jgi:sigma-B regulation protein RsbU (phosphoserine phosphatase)
MFRSSLVTRLNFLLTLCIAGMVLVTSFVDYQFSKRAILKEVDRDTEIVIQDTLADLETHIRGIERSTRLFAGILEQRRYTQREIVEMLEIVVRGRNDIFGTTVALTPQMTGSRNGFAPYYFHGAKGELVFVDLATSNANYTNQAWFREPRGQEIPTWSEPYFDEGGSETLMSTYSVPMYIEGDKGREFYGVVTADLRLSDLRGQLENIQLGKGGFVLLLSRASKILAGPDADWVMKPLLNTLPSNQDLKQWGRLIVAAGRGESSNLRTPCLQQQGMCVVRMLPLPSTGWPLGVYYSEHEKLKPLRSLLWRMALSELCSLLVILFAVSVVSRRITRPLLELVSITDNVAAGNLDAPMPRVRSEDEVGRLITSFGSMQGHLKQHIARLEQETATRNRLQGEMNAATEIQLSMLPDGGRTHVEQPGFHLWATQRPAKSVGGDLYNYFLRDQRELLFAVGDVSDKGVPAALFMARAMTLLQQLADSHLPPQQLLAELNDDLASGNANCMFVTMFCGVLNLDTLSLQFSSAGHTPPSLIRDTECESIKQESGPALALIETLEFPANYLQLQPGDRLVIYTDGIDESFNSDGEQFGTECFNRFLASGHAMELAELGSKAFAAVDKHAGDTPQSDDITLMILSLPQSPDQVFSYTLQPGEAVTSKFLAWLQAHLQDQSEHAAGVTELMLMAEEVITNILKYAELPGDAEVEITLRISTRETELCFSDPGAPFNPLEESGQATLGLDSESAAIGGLGVHLLTALSDSQHYEYRDRRNVLRLRKSH